MPTSRRPTGAVASAALILALIGAGTAPAEARPASTPTVATSATASASAAASAEAAAKVTYPKYGDVGSAVRSLQVKLISAGYLRADLNGGHFGTLTRAAITKLQGDYQLSKTGKVNAATMTALAKAIAKATGPKTWYHREVIGTSQSGRDIIAYRAGEAGKPVVMVVATMHGEENFGQYVAKGLLEGKAIRGVDLWVVPVLNPDGLAHDRRWLNTGVDLNRNFPTSFVVRANTGPKAASEKETRVIMKFLNRINPKYLVSWHQPLYGVDSDLLKNKGLRDRLAKGLNIPRKDLNCNGTCHGTMTQWFNKHHKGAAITVEYGSTARSLKTMKGHDANAVLSAIGGHRAK